MRELDCEIMYNEKIMKAKIRLYGAEATDFRDKEVSKVGSIYTYLAVIVLDYVLIKDKTFYL